MAKWKILRPQKGNSEAGNGSVDRRSKVEITAGDGYSGGGEMRGKKEKCSVNVAVNGAGFICYRRNVGRSSAIS